jgi:hypothetical protein
MVCVSEPNKNKQKNCGRWKSGNPKPGFPLFHHPDSLRRKEELPYKHFQTTRKESSAVPQPPDLPGSSRIGMKSILRAHLALESKLTFRLISGLENALGFGVLTKILVKTYSRSDGCSGGYR